jgi:hypothetical protein
MLNSSIFRSVRMISAALVGLLLLGGCAAWKLAYNNAPELAGVYISSTYDLSDEQSAVVNAELKNIHAWHRKNELPEALKLLAKTRLLLATPAQPAALCAVMDEAEPLVTRVVERSTGLMAQVLLSATPSQLQGWQKANDKRNAKYQKDNLAATPAERLDKRAKSGRESFERLYGSLSDAQVSQLREHYAKSAWDPAISLQGMQTRQKATLALARQIAQDKPPLEQAQTKLMAAIQYNNPKDPSAIQRERLQQETCTLWAALHASASAEQRKTAESRLRGYEADVQALMR